VVAFAVDADALCRRGVFDEVERDAERVVEAESDVTPQPLRARAEHLGELRLEAWQAVLEHRLEPILLGVDRSLDGLAVAGKLGIAAAYFAIEHADQLVHERAVES